MTRHIFITGGVVSSLGKGITAASLGCLLKSRGLKVSIQKFDPYINYDPGTMNPYQHGEIFVTDDGAEADLDLGHYERFIDENLTGDSNVTSGKVYWSAISRERQGFYQGGTVQVIPHITGEIKERILRIAGRSSLDIVITEIGGTVGDIEGLPFLEAIRQMNADMGRENVLYIHVTLIPFLSASNELKTKPTQHSVKELRSIGIQPDFIVCRTDHPLPADLKEKIALFCDTKPYEVIENANVDIIYEVPLMLQEQGLDQMVIEKLGLNPQQPANMTAWREMIERARNLKGSVTVALVGKYVSLADAYISVKESLFHAGLHHGASVKVKMISAEEMETSGPEGLLGDVQAVLIPGGFGDRGIEGKIRAIKWAREKNLPFLGLCLGMQCAVIEFARNVAGLSGAHSTEFAPDTPFPVIHYLPGQEGQTPLGGTLRLGSYPCSIKKGTLAASAYNLGQIHERHRHRFEFNNSYRSLLEEKGMVFSGINPETGLVEIIELPDHPWFVAVQFHPEFKSRPRRPHPLYRDFIGRALKVGKNS